ncbi:MAG: hypothetical protein K2N43_03685 [Lachnospiraceae bacterium]|nr:hypothetical protein [Lachnospiraceae bacterium]
MITVADKTRNDIRQNIGLYVFIAFTVFFMLFSIIWVYHVKVLNAPKVYSDGFGYYLYLPAVIQGDFSFDFIEGWEHPFDLMEVPGGKIDKYPVGVAIMESPFFFLAHAVCLVKDALTGSMTATGYSNLYQYMVLFGGVCYWIAGTILLYKLLNTWLGFSKRVSLLSCIVITYGTNLFHYASYDACFSHVYSYFLFNLFLFYLCWYEKRGEEGNNRLIHTCIFGLLAGLIFMCRNTNIVFVVTYIFYSVINWETLKGRIVMILRPSRAIPIVLTGMITLLPQLLYWHAATGHWFVYSYGANEPFYWLSPQIANFLFSVRKGLFFWSPVLLLAVVGIFTAYQKRRQLYVGLVVFLVLIIYISSAWWSWYYGGSFGQRVAVDFMCLFAIFTADVFDRLGEWKAQGKGGYKLLSCLAYGYCGICIIWNLLCMTAYWYRVLPSDGSDWNTIGDIIGMIGL